MQPQEVVDFISFIWFVLTAEEELGRVPSAADVSGALEATLGFYQLDEATRQRWLAVAETVRSSYEQADVGGRRRWARAGTSIGSARLIDQLVDDVATEIATRIGRLRSAPTASDQAALPIASVEDAVDLLDDMGIFDRLLALPERPRDWRFRASRRGNPSDDVVVTPRVLIMEWISGKPIAEMGESLLSELSPAWRLDQLVDVTTEHFEHFLSWMLGVVVDGVNSRLETAGIPERLCPGLPAFVRYGVNRPLAIELLTSGVGSRVMAQMVAVAAEEAATERAGLREWLSAMSLAEWRQRFAASASELLDLIEYTRARRGSLLRTLLEQGSAQITAIVTDEGGETREASDRSQTTDESERASRLVTIESEPDVPPPGGLLIRAQDRDGEVLATVPLGSYRDLLEVLDAGVPISLAFSQDRLQIQLLLEEEDGSTEG
jgi:hypothetical protein